MARPPGGTRRAGEEINRKPDRRAILPPHKDPSLQVERKELTKNTKTGNSKQNLLLGEVAVGLVVLLELSGEEHPPLVEQR